MSADLEGEHFAHPSEPGAHGHQQWLRESAELAEALKGDPWALGGEPIHRGESVTNEDEMVRLVNEGARRVYCPRCERGHEGACTGPTPEDVERHAALRSEARTAYHAGVPDKHSPEL